MTEAIDDCTEAVNLDGSYLKAYLKRAKWYGKRLLCCKNIVTAHSVPWAFQKPRTSQINNVLFNKLPWFVSELPEKDISNVVVQCSRSILQ